MPDTVISIPIDAAVAVRTSAGPIFRLPSVSTGVAVRTSTSGVRGAEDPLRGINRILTGREAAALDAPPRGTHGLMPQEWGTVESFDIDDAGTDFELRHKGGKLLASGQSSGRLTLAMTLRMPASAVLPERGDTFHHRWRGTDRLFVVWSVSPVYSLRGLRKVDVQSRHELDLGNKYPAPVPAPAYPIT